MNANKTSYLLIILGIILIALTLILNPNSLLLVIDHIIEDLTKDLFIHLFIVGTILFIAGLVNLFFTKEGYGRKPRRHMKNSN